MTPRKPCLPDTTALTHLWTHRDCDSMHRTCTSSSQTERGPSAEARINGLPPS
ncbi:hypothetical protein LEMLEM_LOCUS4380 [Lemmus lemmus]